MSQLGLAAMAATVARSAFRQLDPSLDRHCLHGLSKVTIVGGSWIAAAKDPRSRTGGE
jgi:hypothetical protein